MKVKINIKRRQAMSELRDRALATVISWTDGLAEEVAQQEIVNDIFDMVREEIARSKYSMVVMAPGIEMPEEIKKSNAEAAFANEVLEQLSKKFERG
jgi:hypothetical protein